MKSRLRNITVNNHKFFYWYLAGKRLLFYFTPNEDKNIKFELVFDGFTPPDDNENNCWAFYDISASKDNNQSVIELVMPKFAAVMIEYLLLTENTLFTQRKIHKIDAVTLLNKMGYEDINPVWRPDW